MQAVQENKQRSRIAKVFVRSPSKRLNGSSGTESHSSTLQNGTSGSGSEGPASNGKPVTVSSLGNKVTSKDSGSLPRKAWEQQNDDVNEPFLIEQVARTAGYDSPQLGTKQQNHKDNGMSEEQLLEEGLVNVRLVADEKGRFGFNVKGGADLKLPVLVSRVAPNTPADLSNPRIAEGDQVLMINGRDISALKHEQIVSLIRSSREFRGGELVLTIKPQGK